MKSIVTSFEKFFLLHREPENMLGTLAPRRCRNVLKFCEHARRYLHYVQGQSHGKQIREYFYYIDHQGQLFLDDARIKNFTSCFKEKDFLAFFFSRLKLNRTGQFQEEFPYLSPCGRERNYVRCDDKPIVYTHISKSDDGNDLLCFGGIGNALAVDFQPTRICMLPNTGRVYYPASPHLGGIGLVRSALAIELSKWFDFNDGENNPPTHFQWNGQKFELTNELLGIMDKSPYEVADLMEGT